MLENRVIPCLQLLDNSLVKTVKFRKYEYIGDPLNTCRIFNELEVDEMLLLDIRATVSKKPLDFNYLQALANECFMPLAYGGGIKTVEDARQLFRIGFEKIVINSAFYRNINLVKQIAETFGTQSIIASVDVKKDFIGTYHAYSNSGHKKERGEVIGWMQELQKEGVGEILLTDIAREGTWSGFDIPFIRKVTQQLKIPVIVHGGAGCANDIEDAVNCGGASAVALGNMVVFQQKDMGVLINYKKDYDFKGR